MSEDEIIDKLIESAYQDATRQGAFYALIKKEYENGEVFQFLIGKVKQYNALAPVISREVSIPHR